MYRDLRLGLPHRHLRLWLLYRDPGSRRGDLHLWRLLLDGDARLLLASLLLSALLRLLLLLLPSRLAELLNGIPARLLIALGLELAGLLDTDRCPSWPLLKLLHEALAWRPRLRLLLVLLLCLSLLLLLLLLRLRSLRERCRDDGRCPEKSRRAEYSHRISLR